ncbi:hypothetical protein CVP05_10395 [Conservatibacter flavescens]|uniref:6-phosphofructokinase n=1 Tax=Conservatibacter flavescens TaxID=28161 RepID=A0A2M8S0M6_9PAST|nr:hypothetical protein CVP05_10395 [Conservatibacter flavescens]
MFLLLSGCTTLYNTTPTQLDYPTTLKYHDKTYYLIKESDLGSIVRYFYVGKNKTENQWQSAIELLLDRENKLTFAERIALRKKVYSNQGIKHFDTYEKAGFLYSYVIYRPTKQNPNWQVNVAKGKNIDKCGFVQYQYSLKIEKTKKLRNLNDDKVFAYLKKYAVDKELHKLHQADWQWACVSSMPQLSIEKQK